MVLTKFHLFLESTIRQQLTNTEDIRRIRKKAPCTRLEISMIQKQFLEDEMFSKSILTGEYGVSMEFASLHSQAHDLSETRVSQNDVNTASFEAPSDLKLISQNDENGTNLEAPNAHDESEMDGSMESLPVRGNGEARPLGTTLRTENQQWEDHVVSSEPYHTQMQMKPTDAEKPRSSQEELLGEAEIEIDGRSISVADAVNPVVAFGVESSCPIDLVSGDICNSSADLLPLASMDKTGEADASAQIDELSVSTDQKLDMLDNSNWEGVDGSEAADRKEDDIAGAEIRTQVGASVEVGMDIQNDCSVCMDGADPLTTFSVEIASIAHVVPVYQAMEEIRREEQVAINENKILDAEVDYNAKNSASNGFYGEELTMDSSYVAKVNVDVRSVSLDGGGNSGRQDSYPLSIMDMKTYVPDLDHCDVSCFLVFCTVYLSLPDFLDKTTKCYIFLDA
ncbi:unnamed protein product [Ilex paraguariensis]|uniref:Uncharacterized protein n=1 Tax=Ilex paraguariensis TaxID=185542 RepID=A0ABC8SYW9_9AQUA